MDSRYFIYLFVLSAATIYGLVHFKKLSIPYQILVCYLCITLLSETLSRYLAYKIGNSMPAYHLLIPVQILFYSYFYAQFLSKSKQVRSFIFASGGVVLLLCIANSWFVQGILTMPSNGIMLLAMLVITLTLFQFKQMIVHSTNVKLIKHPLFWFNLGGLVFYCLTFFVFGYYNLPGTAPDWAFFMILATNLIMYCAYFYALHLDRVKDSNSTQ